MPDSVDPEAAIAWDEGVLLRLLARRGDCEEWEVRRGEAVERALLFPSLTGPAAPGDAVRLNTTAAQLHLGTGGWHFALPLPAPTPAFAGREHGHLMKLRYTPLQHRVHAAEEEGSPHREAISAFRSLARMPVVVAELHSQAGVVALAARETLPDLRLAVVMTDHAALPAPLSRLLHRLRGDGHLVGVVTVGQAFGGDCEAVSLHSGLIAARQVLQAEAVVVTQGPGNAGTGTEYGFSGLGLAEAVHAAQVLGGVPALAVRYSQADPRPRHQGISHHTLALLRCILCPASVPWPFLEPEVPLPAMARPQRVKVGEALAALEPYEPLIRSMGRGLMDDPLFYHFAAAAGVWAAEACRRLRAAGDPE